MSLCPACHRKEHAGIDRRGKRMPLGCIDWGSLPLVLTVLEVADLMETSVPDTLRRIDLGEVFAVRIGSRLRVPKGRLMRLLGYEARP